jgi:CBS domain-containing protein
MQTVGDLLKTKGNETHVVGQWKTVLDGLRVMAERNVGALVVVEGSRVVGIFSERDYARKVVLVGRVSTNTPISDVMTREVFFVSPPDELSTCMALMTTRHVRHLPVMQDGSLVGVISIGDVVKSVIDEQQFRLDQLERYLLS